LVAGHFLSPFSSLSVFAAAAEQVVEFELQRGLGGPVTGGERGAVFAADIAREVAAAAAATFANDQFATFGDCDCGGCFGVADFFGDFVDGHFLSPFLSAPEGAGNSVLFGFLFALGLTGIDRLLLAEEVELGRPEDAVEEHQLGVCEAVRKIQAHVLGGHFLSPSLPPTG
jgi:hypothetical protein